MFSFQFSHLQFRYRKKHHFYSQFIGSHRHLDTKSAPAPLKQHHSRTALPVGVLSHWWRHATPMPFPASFYSVSFVSRQGVFVFFSVFVGALEHLLAGLHLPEALAVFLFGLFELTGGVGRATALSPLTGEALCCFFVGWSGISVHCQLISLCNVPRLSFRSYWLSKLAHGGLNVLLFLLARTLFGL